MAKAARHTLSALFEGLASSPTERLEIAYFDASRKLSGTGRFESGNATLAVIPFRSIVADALAANAASVILAHNHTSGDPTPSARDYSFTRRLAQLLRPIGIRIDDHLILVAGGDSFSFRAAGLL